jgi:bacterioferritin-associated ferredoxin
VVPVTTVKTMLCRCEDITADETIHAMDKGLRTFEDLKRYLGVGTGPCQGKSCVQACMQQVAAYNGIPLDDVDVMTMRPPVRPIPFATLAATDADPAGGGA